LAGACARARNIERGDGSVRGPQQTDFADCPAKLLISQPDRIVTRDSCVADSHLQKSVPLQFRSGT